MIINTQKIRKYLKVIQFVREKGHVQYSNLYLDFDNKEILFQNSSLIYGKLKIEYTGEKEKNLYVPADKFLCLVNMYDEIEFKDGVFYGNDSKYELIYFDGDMSFPALSIPDHTLEITEELYKNFKNAFTYIDDDPYSTLHGLFLKDNRIVATNRVKLYDYRLSAECKDVKVPYIVVKIMDVLGADKQIRIVDEEGSSVTILSDDDLVIWQASDLSLELININDPGFTKSYDHKEALTVDRKELLSELMILTPFLECLPNNRIVLRFENDNELKLIVNSSEDTTDFAKVEKIFTKVTYSDFNYFSGKELLLSAMDLKTALSDLNSDEIRIKVNFDIFYDEDDVDKENPRGFPAIDIFQNEDFHIVLTKLQAYFCFESYQR